MLPPWLVASVSRWHAASAATGRRSVAERGDVLVVGAGSSGLVAAKTLRLHGFDVTQVEQTDDLGGNWNIASPTSRVITSTHMISSKPFTQFPDFPMPDHAPDYLHHTEVLAYLRRYADHFGLTGRIRFGTTVEACERDAEGWTVQMTDGTGTRTEHYRRLVVANGHNWAPKWPDYPGQDGFSGELLHAADYKDAAQLAGKRVVVVGAGNTGCDIAVEGALRAAETYHSTRRGYWYAPKYALGRPADQVSDLIFSLKLPIRVTQWLFERTAQLVVGRYERFGLPTPDHRFLESHPIVNQTLLYHVGHGDLTPVPDIERFAGDEVVFTEGRRVEADLVVFATGYLIRFPFLEDDALPWQDGRPQLYRNVLHPDHDDLAVIGLIQPDSGQFCLVHWQTVLLARYLQLVEGAPRLAAPWRRGAAARLDDRSQGGITLLDSTRHLIEVEHLDYLEALADDIAELDQLLRDEVAA